MSDIDFIVLWVDGKDPEWRQELDKWSGSSSGENSVKRFRDWDNLQYMFRSFEKFTPWVRKIHFVTWGHMPEWLNTDNPKLNIVKHQDFINNKNLPLFNSQAIELNFHQIGNLSEQFVYFNDDMFILNAIAPERFFKNNLPRDILVFTTILMTHLAHIRLNNLLIINKHFKKTDFLKKKFFKWFNFKYGFHLIKSLLLLPWPHITGIMDPHQPQPLLKSTYSDLWENEFKILSETSKSKFRKNTEVNQYILRYWQLMKGNFLPVSASDSFCIQVQNLKDAEYVSRIIKKQKYTLLCINDLLDDHDDALFDSVRMIVNESFDKILPDKSSFEK